MKITGLETICLSRPHELERQWFTASYRTIKADCAIVLIHTDEGLQGIKEASPYGWPLLIREIATPGLVGKGRLHRTADPTLLKNN
jgi:L-alanine-DL-glutamate epimerase-like enolase superfamily enzyme